MLPRMLHNSDYYCKYETFLSRTHSGRDFNEKKCSQEYKNVRETFFKH